MRVAVGKITVRPDHLVFPTVSNTVTAAVLLLASLVVLNLVATLFRLVA
jgi:hypothetical protein